MDNRIRLAKATGLITDIEMPSTKGKAPFRIVYANGGGQICDNPLDHLPDPFTDANDCVALIANISEHYSVIVHFSSDRHPAYVDFYRSNDTLNHPTHKWYGNDWKQGVCELALKVLDTVHDEQQK